MTAEGIKINVVPGVVVPSMMLLNIVPVMVSVDVVSDTLVKLASDRDTVDVKGYVLIITMIQFGRGAKATMFAVPGSQKICVNVEASCEGKFVVRHQVVLMCPYPYGGEWTSELASTRGYDRK